MEKDELIDVAALTRELVEDRVLSDSDVDQILAAARVREQQQVLTVDEMEEILKTARGGTLKMTFERIPRAIKIFAVLLLLGGLSALLSFVNTALTSLNAGIDAEAINQFTTSTIVVEVISLVASFANAVLAVIVGVRLLRGNRGYAGALVWFAVGFGVVGVVCSLMLFGASVSLLFDLAAIATMVAFSIYLNPSLEREDRLRRGLRDIDLEAHAEQGTLGLADKGKGFIRLDFFNVFWTFTVCSVLGLLVEIAWHMIVVDPGVYQDRAGFLFGPFSPIYGCGAVLMTVALNRIKDKNVLLIFLVCAVIGGGFEYLASWIMEIGIGARAWDYSGWPLGDLFDGRTCPQFASMFGLLGVVWIKAFLPLLLKVINRIPWNWRASVTLVAAAFMLTNAVMTVQALDSWYSRVSGKVPATALEQFYAEHFDNDYMQNRFQTMEITPQDSARS